MLRTVLDSLPTNLMSLFPVSVKEEKKLDKLGKDFLWQDSKDVKAYQLLRWITVTTTKVKGLNGIEKCEVAE